MVEEQIAAAIPIAFLDRDLVSERLLQLVARRGRQATKVDRRLVAADRGDAGRLFRREDALDRIEIRQPPVMIVGETLALDRLPGVVADELKRAGAHDVLFVPVLI